MAGKVGNATLLSATSPASMRSMESRAVLILLFEGVQSLDVTGPLEVFAGANSYLAGRAGPPAYQLRTAGPGAQPVRTSSGLTLVPDADLASAGVPHTLVVPGGQGTRAPAPEVIGWLRHNAPPYQAGLAPDRAPGDHRSAPGPQPVRPARRRLTS